MGLSSGVNWAKGPLPVSSEEVGLGDRLSGPLRPTFNKAVTCLLGSPSFARGGLFPLGGVVGMEIELLAIEDAVVRELLSGRLKFTDEALMEEASRYSAVPKTSFSLGLRGSTSSSPLWGHVEALGVLEGISSGAKRKMGQILLCVVRIGVFSALGGWSEPSWGSVDIVSVNELALVPVGLEFASPIE